MTPSVGKALLEPFERFFLCTLHVVNWLRSSQGSGDTSTHSRHLAKKKKSMKASEWGRAKGGEIYKWINQWTPSPASQTSPYPSPSWTPQMCVCAADKRRKTNWSSSTLTAFGRVKKKKKMMAFTCRNYWRAAGPDELTSFVSVAHEGPVEKLPPEIGSSGGEVMDCALLASRLPSLSVEHVLPFSLSSKGGAVYLAAKTFFFFSCLGKKKRKNGKRSHSIKDRERKL